MQKKKKKLIEYMNTITRRERRTYIGKHLSCIKTATDFCLLLSGLNTDEISIRE